MSTIIDIGYYVFLLITAIIGVAKYKVVDNAMKAIIMLLLITVISEALSYLAITQKEHSIRYAIFHVFNIVQVILLTQFFIHAVKPYYHAKLIIASFVAWPVIGFLNIIFLQPINTLNTNILMLESFSIITMSLYYIYWLLKQDITKPVFRNPHFQFAVVSLINWSGTFFFWAFIGVLYNEHWAYSNAVMDGHMILNILIYSSIAAILFFYPKMKRFENH